MRYSREQIKAIKSKGQNFTVNDFLKNEDINYHSENAVALTDKFGTPSEIEEIHHIANEHKRIGHIPHDLYKRRYEISNKYYQNLLRESKK